MLSDPPSARRPRSVTVLVTGGTISMTGEDGASPDLDAAALLATLPGDVGIDSLQAETVINLPSVHLSGADQLDICRRARDTARRGIGVVVTHGTDTLEETAMLCDVLHDADAPIVFTGAIRPASSPGADGPANLFDAISVAAAGQASGMGVLVCFGGEIHHARTARKSDATSASAFSSPRTGPLGRVGEGRAVIWSRIARNPVLDPPSLDARVLVVPSTAGDDGELVRAALGTGLDGLVVGALGAGHVSPAILDLWSEAAGRMPVVVYSRPERGAILKDTYGFRGSERDLRSTGAIPAGFLSPQAARMKLLACLGSGLGIDEIREVFGQDDC